MDVVRFLFKPLRRFVSAGLIIIGVGIIILAFVNSPLQFQLSLGLIGLGFVFLGFAEAKRAQSENRVEEKLHQLISGLDEIREELKKEEPPERKGIAIAEVITSGLKYYAEHMNKQEKEE